MIVAGIVLALGAAVTNACASVLQAAEDREMPELVGRRARLLFRLAHRRRWLAGVALMAVAGVLQVTALAFAPITMVQPLLATGQLVLLGVARLKLGERVGPRESIGAIAIIAGVMAVVYVAPHQSTSLVAAGKLAPPVAVVGGLASLAYLVGRVRPAAQMLLVGGAGLAYAWADFNSKLLAGSASTGRLGLVVLFVVLLIGMGALAFMQETIALQHWAAVTVAPVIGAIKIPLPVLMALWAGMEPWPKGAGGIALLLCGLAVIVVGGSILSRSKALTVISAGQKKRKSEGHSPAGREQADAHAAAASR